MRFLGVLMSVIALNAYGQTGLIGGEPADPREFPASVYSSQGSSRCSATVIGERVLLIAAHCVSNGGTARFSVLSNQYSAKCDHHPDYRRNSTADWSLCKVDRKVEGIPYEVLKGDSEGLSRGTELLLTGYGCVRPGGGGGNDGIYRIGNASITSMPSGVDYDTVTRGTAALCYGDSGGPAFFVDGEDRYLIGVNSRGDIRTTSYLSSVYVTKAKDWFKTWSSTNQVKLCGMHSDAEGCRNATPNPTPPPQVPDCNDELVLLEQTVQGLKVCLSVK